MLSLGLLILVGLALALYGWLVALLVGVISGLFLRWPSRRPTVPAVLKQHEEVAIELLRKGMALSATEVATLQTFLLHAFGNLEFNARCLSRKKVLGTYDPEKQQLLNEMATYAYKTSLTKNFEELLVRAEKVFETWKSGKIPAEDSRIRKEELRRLESSASFHVLISRLDGLGAIEGEPKLEQLRNWTQRAYCWHRQVLKVLADAGPQFVPQSGDLIAFTLENHRFIRGKRHNFIIEWFYQCLGSDATHLAIALEIDNSNSDSENSPKEKTVQESHMWGEPSIYSRNRFSVGSFGNRFYRPNAALFVDEKLWGEKILKTFGKGSFDDVIMDEYRKSVVEWHRIGDEKKLFQSLRNDAHYRILVALIFNTLSPFARPWRQRAQFQADLFKPANQVACSEFVLKAVLQCADLMGRRLATRLELKDASGEEIVNPNINPNRRVARYSPGLVIHRVLKKGWCRELPPNPVFCALIK